MNQPSLFESTIFAEACRVIDHEGNVEHIARSTDPTTSHEGADHIAGQLPTLQRRMYRAFQRPLTANEAAALCVRSNGGCHESYRKRKKELVDAGLIACVGRRKCGHTGNGAEVFQVVRIAQ